jgi:hypothetical protein
MTPFSNLDTFLAALFLTLAWLTLDHWAERKLQQHEDRMRKILGRR